MATMKDDVLKSHGDMKQDYEAARSGNETNRRLQEKDRDYHDGYQISPEQRKKLMSRGQRPVVENNIQLAINGIVGVVQSNNNEPRAYPRQPNATNSSDVVTKLLRYVADRTEYQDLKLELTRDLAIEGIAAVFTSVKTVQNFKRQTQTIQVTASRILPDEFFYDPYSQAWDFRDARYLGWAKWWDAKDVLAKYPEATKGMGVDSLIGDIGFSTIGNQPKIDQWVDLKRKRVVVVEMYYCEYDAYEQPTWYRSVFTNSVVLENDKAPYEDDQGQSICPITAISCYKDRQNNRYGLVRGMIDSQDEINSRRSRALFLSNSNRSQRVDNSAPFVDDTTVQRAASDANGVMPFGYQIIPNVDMINSHMSLYSTSVAFINRFAPSPAVLGRVSESLSGKAKLVDQQAGLTELGEFLDRLNTLEKYVYRKFWFAAQQWMTEEETITITGDPKAIEHLTINQVVGEQPGYNPETGQIEMVPIIENYLAEMDVNVEIESVPANTTLQSETFDAIARLLASNIPMEDPRWRILFELADIPDKQRVIDMYEKNLEEAQLANAQAQQTQERQAQMLELAQVQKHQSDISNQEAQTRKYEAEALKSLADADSKLATTDIQKFNYTGGLTPFNPTGV